MRTAAPVDKPITEIGRGIEHNDGFLVGKQIPITAMGAG
jgi:hypothetical protein